jgi:methyl-accepting chemotaxis protein
MKWSLRKKIIGVAIVAAAIPALTITLLVTFRQRIISEEIQADSAALVTNIVGASAREVYESCQLANELLQVSLDHNLNVARNIFQKLGPVTLGPQTVEWMAYNQFTAVSTILTVPRLSVGNDWLAPNYDLQKPSLVVDEVEKLVGGTCTIFQRINDTGDMLRVATNVQTKEGKRGIGSYIPATNPDGAPNLVVATVLQGKTYRGRAFVLNSWLMTLYEPMKDAGGKVIGMLYIGIKLESVSGVRRSITEMVVGKSGFVSVFYGSGKTQGQAVFPTQGQPEGSDFKDRKDARAATCMSATSWRRHCGSPPDAPGNIDMSKATGRAWRTWWRNSPILNRGIGSFARSRLRPIFRRRKNGCKRSCANCGYFRFSEEPRHC